MKRLFIFILFASVGITTIAASSAKDSINKVVVNLYSQLLVCPQEKIYVQTDRPYYLNGEKLFFRAFLLQASTLKRADWSRYIYVELVSPTDSVLLRQQIRVQDGRMFYGDLKLPENLPEGSYRLRAYTRYMENIGEKFFFSKAVFIADPNASKTNVQVQTSSLNSKEMRLDLKFTDAKKYTLKPQGLTIFSVKDKQDLLPQKDSWADYSTRLKADAKTILIDYRDGSHSFRKYLNIEQTETSPELSFFPEGGQLIAEQNCRVAFKALLPNGNVAEVKGKIVDSQGNEVLKFGTTHEGMGTFNFVPRIGESYLAKINWQGEEKAFALPQATENGVALQAAWQSDSLQISVLGRTQQPCFLLIHRQGVPTYFKPWDFSQKEIVLHKKDFATGVSHLLLLNNDFKPISERLIFNNLHDRICPKFSTSKSNFKPGEEVNLQIDVPKSEADTIFPTFAISVTDDKDVAIDTTTNIISEILLSSELEGRISNPLQYFGSDPKALEDADLLMLTNGWRRYGVEEALLGNIQKPAIRPETSQSFSGKLKGLLNKSLAGGGIKMIPVGYKSPLVAQSETDGTFRFDNFEFPDSTAYFFQAVSKTGSENITMNVDTILYPDVTVPFLIPQLKRDASTDILTKTMENYVVKAGKKYINEYGMRQVDLPEVMIKGTKNENVPERKRIDNYAPPGLEPSRFISPDEIDATPPASFEELITRIIGVSVDGVRAIARGQTISFAVNGIVRTSSISELQSYINVSDIAQVDLFLEPSQTLAFGPSLNPVIALTVWPSDYIRHEAILNRKKILPLGYQVPVEFYSPKYDTPEALNSSTPDLRSTIFWKPNMVTDATGKASVSFYAADSETTYSAIVEGFGAGKKLIYGIWKGAVKVSKH